MQHAEIHPIAKTRDLMILVDRSKQAYDAVLLPAFTSSNWSTGAAVHTPTPSGFSAQDMTAAGMVRTPQSPDYMGTTNPPSLVSVIHHRSQESVHRSLQGVARKEF